MIFLASTFSLLALFLAASYKTPKLSPGKLIVPAILIRLFFILAFQQTSSDDMYATLSAGSILLEKKQHYGILYFPFFPLLGASAILLQHIIHPFITLKLIYLLFEILAILVLYRIDRKAAWLFAFNPITVISGLVHGQFDIIPVFFLLLSVYFLKRRKEPDSMLSFSFAVFTKTWPIAFVMPFVRNIRNRKWLFLIPLIPALSVLLYSFYSGISPLNILYPVKNYRGLFGVWSWSQIITFIVPDLSPVVPRLFGRLFVVIFLIFSFLLKEKNPIRSILILMLFFFSFTPTFGIQWLTWIIPFIFLVRANFWRAFVFLATVYFSINFLAEVYPWMKRIDIIPVFAMYAGLTVWFIILAMLFKMYIIGKTYGKKSKIS